MLFLINHSLSSWDARKYQKTILVQGKESKKLVLRLGRRLGKCLPGDVIVQDSKTGDRVTIKELYNRKKANIFSIDDKEKLFNNETNIIMENGINSYEGLQNRQDSCIKINALFDLNMWCEANINIFKQIEELKKIGFLDVFEIPHLEILQDENKLKEFQNILSKKL